MELNTAGYRLSPVSPLFLFIEAVKKMVFPLLIGIVGTSGDRQDLFLIGIAALASVITIVQFWFYHYWLEADRLVVKQGILFKSLRQVPYERIQNLNVERNLLHKLFNVATLQIESASGVKPEAVIRVISNDQVKHIQDTIKRRTGHTIGVQDDAEDSAAADASAASATDDPAMFRMSHQEVSKYGFISHQALVPIGIVGSILSQNDYYRSQFIGFMQKFIGDLHVESWGWSQWLIYGLGFAVLMLVSIWLSSIALAFLKLYRFQINRVDDNLHAEMGLLTKLNANIPLKRIQLIKIRHSPLHRYFKRVSIKMETAGGVTEQSGLTMRWIAPLIAAKQWPQLLSRVQPEVDWQGMDWQPVAARAWKRVFKRLTFFVLLLCAPLVYVYHGWGLLPLLLLPLNFWYAKAFIKHAAYAINDQVIAWRQGVFFHTMGVVKVGKIQNLSARQTPFDRRNGMARLSVDTAGSNPVTQDINIHYLNTAEVHAMMTRLSRQVSQVKFVW
ncbi:PH domain-containing protein [Marinicella meishanensis]|uniref:PH domain-containing protein n=1 Tax=Marinicella meishanensis TaxID=2873263 RepID=UPI001CC06F76|nr:PH domain-containing protein [Marinicella sp. NBU2979]